MKKILLGVVLSVLLVANSAFAMTFQQPVKIGSITFPPTNGILITGISYSTLTLLGKWQNDSLYTAEGTARWGNETTGIYYVFEKYPPRFGGKDKNFLVNAMVMTSIYKIENDGNIAMYLIKSDGHAAFARNYVLLGRRQDGEWVKYFDIDELKKKYFGSNRVVLDDVAHFQNNTIIIKYAGLYKSIDIGEFRFKWDERAQWFGVEHIVY